MSLKSSTYREKKRMLPAFSTEQKLEKGQKAIVNNRENHAVVTICIFHSENNTSPLFRVDFLLLS